MPVINTSAQLQQAAAICVYFLLLLEGPACAVFGLGPPFCGAVEGPTDNKTPLRNLQLICDDDTGHAKIEAITAAYFTAVTCAAPSCPDPVRPAGCQLDNQTVAAAVAKLCVDSRSCLLPMGERSAGHTGGWPAGAVDPCPGIAKRLFVQAQCSSGVGHSVVPGPSLQYKRVLEYLSRYGIR